MDATQVLDVEKELQFIEKSEIDKLEELTSYAELRKQKIIRVICKILIWCWVLILLPILIFISVIVFSPTSGHNMFGYTYYLVTSNSMEPEINESDLIIVKTDFSVEDITIGTDITFLRENDGKIVTHRVKSFKDTESGRVYITRGVNNNFDDKEINFNDILGIKYSVKPILGRVITFFRTTGGMIFMFSMFAIIFASIYISFLLSNDIRATGK